MKEEMKKEGKDRGCRELKRLYKKKKTSLEYCTMEGGTRGGRLGLRNESLLVSLSGEDLAQ
jgi:hypothetical protein